MAKKTDQQPDDNTNYQLEYQTGPYIGTGQFDTEKEAITNAKLMGYDRWRVVQYRVVGTHNW